MNNNYIYEKIKKNIESKFFDFDGVVGLSFTDLKSKYTFDINGCEIFPVASTIKIHILIQILNLVEKNELDLNQNIEITNKLHSAGSGILSHLDNEINLSLLDIINFMIILSDNTATNYLIDLAGFENTNDIIKMMGLKNTKLQRKMEDQEAVQNNIENFSTANECNELFNQLYHNKPTDYISKKTIEILSKPKKGYFNRIIDAKTKIANKPGGMPYVRCDSGIIFLKNNPYILSIFSKLCTLESYEQEYFIVNIANYIHKFMLNIDKSNQYGQGIR